MQVASHDDDNLDLYNFKVLEVVTASTPGSVM
jgi:hypothetical protein